MAQEHNNKISHATNKIAPHNIVKQLGLFFFFFVFTLLHLGQSSSYAGSDTPQLPCNMQIPKEWKTSSLTLQEQLKKLTVEETLNLFLGVPYRIDGVTDEKGQNTYFAASHKKEKQPGLNCSGFVVTATRLLLGKNISVDEAKKDILGDSGPNAPMGEDWDFGWDIIMNLSALAPERRLLLPKGKSMDPAKTNGREMGYSLESREAWKELLTRFKTGKLYLVSWSQKDAMPSYPLMHYHTGLIYKTPQGKVWLYQTTRQGGSVNKRDLASTEGLESFLRDFISKRGYKRYLSIIEIPLPPSKIQQEEQ